MKRPLDLRHVEGWHFMDSGVATSLFPSDGWAIMIVSEWDDRDHLIGLSEVRLVPETCLTDAMLALASESYKVEFLH